MDKETNRPLIVMGAFPASGHMEGPLRIAAHLTSRGFQVFFLSGDDFAQQARDAGAEPWPNMPLSHITPNVIAGQRSLPQGHLRWNYQQKHIFLDGVPVRHAILTRCLESVRERFPDRQVVIFNDSLFLGAVPFILGAPPPRGYHRRPPVIHFHTTINWTASEQDGDIAPYGLALPPAKTPEERARYRMLYDEMRPAARDTVAYANRIFRSVGTTEDLDGDFFFSELLGLPDVVLMACSPSLEYPRSISRQGPGVRYIGGLPPKGRRGNRSAMLPEWLTEMRERDASAKREKKVVFVSQGTANIDDYGELVIPTLRAFADREDVTVVAVLGKRRAGLPPDVLATVPDGAKVIDYLPYDDILPWADVFVFNGGYGGLMHGIANGTPMVIAGTAADKGEVAVRAEWAGIAVNLATSTPSPDMIRDAVYSVLADGSKFGVRVMEMRAENVALDALVAIENQIRECVESMSGSCEQR
jgi:UDP:flavonoid glycosyltransferase YjiC (YdhE family)